MKRRWSRLAICAAIMLFVSAGFPPRGTVLMAASPPVAAPERPSKRPPKVDLPAEARTLAETWARRLGQGYTTRIDSHRHVVYVSAVDPKAFAHVVRLLGSVHDAHLKFLFARPLDRNVTVILPTVKDYRKLVPLAKAHGVYDTRTRTLASISFSSVLVHEFIHALHHNDQRAAGQKHPIWITEGLAMLFQASRLKGARLDVLDGGGVDELQAAIRAGKARSLGQMCRLSPKAFMAEAELSYRQSHHVMLYLHRRGKLRTFYEAYKSGYRRDATGAEALAKTLGLPLAQVDAAWRKWVLARPGAWRPAHKQQAHLGIRMGKSDHGVEVTGYLRNSTAHLADLLKPGDVIISLAGRPVRSARDLADAVQVCQPGQIVDIEIIRSGRTVIVKHRLGLAPR